MDIDVRNIAGIIDGSAEIRSGINTVQASNWQGKSSFIRAVETAFGTKATLTEGRDEGEVSVTVDGETHTVTLEQRGSSVVSRGNPVLDDEYDQLLADLFAFLGEDNDIRRAVRSNDDLKGLLTRPLEMEDLDARIRELGDEQDSIQAELRRAERKADELISLRQRQNGLESELQELREQEAEFENAMTSDKRVELSELRAERNRVVDLIDRLENTLERSREKLTEAHEEYEGIEVADASEVEGELVDVREKYERAQEDKELLQTVYSANKRLLEEDRLDLLSDIERGLMADTYTCWLCGSDTDEAEMEAQLEAMGDKVLELRETVGTYESRIDELEAERDEIKRQQRRRTDLENRISELESTISERDENLSSAEERLSTIEQQIDELDAEVDVVDKEMSEIQSEIKYKEAELEDLEEEIAEAETAAERIETLENAEEEVKSKIRELRTRKDEMRDRIRTAFDDSIRTIVPMFETSFESARLTSEFELVVARDGREVTLDALSEGEVELLGLVTAIAGFEAYDVGSVTPVVLVDQLGGLADDNLTTLANYLGGLTQSLVLTAYPENSALGDHRIDPTSWNVVRPAEPMKS